MAYDTKTLEVLHRLTSQGQEHYQKMLEEKADEILFKHEHPIKWIMLKVKQLFT